MSIQTADLISALTALGVLPKSGGGVPLTAGAALRGFAPTSGSATSAGTLGVGEFRGRRIVIPSKMNLTAFFYVNAATAGGAIEGGMYSVDASSVSGAPGAKVVDFGPIAMDTGATLVQGATFDIAAGEYWQVEHNSIATSTNGVHRVSYADGADNYPSFSATSRSRFNIINSTATYVSPMADNFATYGISVLGSGALAMGFLFRINSVG